MDESAKITGFIEPEALRNQGMDGKFADAQLKDLLARIFYRKLVAITVLALLFLQNVAILYLFYGYLQAPGQWKYAAFAALISGTLFETYKVLKIIIQWLFKDSAYKPDVKA